jgi:hypothetical protein
VAHPWIVDGGVGLQIWRMAVNTMNKVMDSQEGARGDPSAWGLGKGLTTPHHEKPACYKMLHKASELDRFFGTT